MQTIDMHVKNFYGHLLILLRVCKVCYEKECNHLIMRCTNKFYYFIVLRHTENMKNIHVFHIHPTRITQLYQFKFLTLLLNSVTSENIRM